MTSVRPQVPEIDPTTAEALRDPFTTYARARERSPVARLLIPGVGPVWAVLRHETVRAVLNDPTFAVTASSFLRPAGLSEEYLAYLHTMTELDGPEHARLRRLVSTAFTARRAAEFRPRIEPIVARLLDELPSYVEDGVVDLLRYFSGPLPIEVICELVGIPAADRPAWREHGSAVAAGERAGFVAAVPFIVDSAKAAITRRRAEPGDDLVGELVRVRAEDGDRLSEVELVTLVWHLVLAGQTPTNLVANGVAGLLTHPGQLAALRAEPDLTPRAVEEMMRWCGPAMLTAFRFAKRDTEIAGVPVGNAEPVTAALVAANRDPRTFAEPDRFDIRRSAGPSAHVGFGYGPHFCLGASLARTQTEVAVSALLSRFPNLSLAVDEVEYAPDPGTWRVRALPVRLS